MQELGSKYSWGIYLPSHFNFYFLLQGWWIWWLHYENDTKCDDNALTSNGLRRQTLQCTLRYYSNTKLDNLTQERNDEDLKHPSCILYNSSKILRHLWKMVCHSQQRNIMWNTELIRISVIEYFLSMVN